MVESLVEGWPSDLEIKEACFSALREELPDREQLDRTVATQVLVLGFPTDSDVSEYFAECIETSDYRFVFFSDNGVCVRPTTPATHVQGASTAEKCSRYLA